MFLDWALVGDLNPTRALYFWANVVHFGEGANYFREQRVNASLTSTFQI
jgi:hypothetical protein